MSFLPRGAWLGLAALAALALAGCSSGKNLRVPAELHDIVNPELKIDKVWSSSAGDGSDSDYSGLQMSVQSDALFAADTDGRVYAFDPMTGSRIWRSKTRARVIAGPSVSGNMVLVGTLDAQVIALKRSDGTELWRTTLSSEVLAPPTGNGNVLVARTVDGHIYGLLPVDGKRLWNFDRYEPNLTLRGLSEPLVLGGHVFAGLDNGHLVSIQLANGTPAWDQVIAVPSGRTELDRITDIDAGLLINNNNIFAASFGGELACVDMDSGEVLWRRSIKSYTGMAQTSKLVIVTDESGVVWALDKASGAAAWKQKGLLYRKLSPPAVLNGYVVVGDYEGYLHWLDPEDGHFVARTRVGGDPIRADMKTQNGMLYVMNTTGKIVAITTKPR